MALDSTIALLNDTVPIPSTMMYRDSVDQDSDEDEIFFGATSSKEQNGTL